MMTRRLMTLIALPILIGSFGCAALTATAQSPTRLAQSSPQPNPQSKRHHAHNFAAAAQKLGVTEANLKAALGVPATPPTPGIPGQRLPHPDFKAAAAKLGVTEQQLMDVLGRPQGGNRPDNVRPQQ